MMNKLHDDEPGRADERRLGQSSRAVTSDQSWRPTRRALLTGGSLLVGSGIAVLLNSCTTAATPNPTPTATATAGASGTAGSTGPRTWAELGNAVTGSIVRAGDTDWDTDRLLQNPRFDSAAPRGILRVASAEDVAAGLAFARNAHIPVALRSGGHSYTGWSAGGADGTDVPPSLVISTAGLDAVTVSADGSSVTVGPGAPLITVYDALSKRGRAIGAGSCPTVGTGGLTLGGGVGVLVRKFGLTCDQLTAVTIVTADGAVHQVSEHSRTATERDLFWACRGGGGGTAGVVTELTFRTAPAPEVTMFTLVFPWSAARAVVLAWQDWAPTADPDLWSSLKLLGGSRHAAGPTVTVSGTWAGVDGGADDLVNGFIASVGTTPSTHTATMHSYGDAMAAEAGCLRTPVGQCHTGAGGALQRVSEAATSSIGNRRLTDVEVDVLLGQVESAADVSGMTEGGVALDALGGAVGTVASADSAFPHRDALCTVQYTATFQKGADPTPLDAYVRGFRDAMTPMWGSAAYANYCDRAITDPSDYFGENTTRLRSIATAADPGKLFAQPHWV